MNTSLKRLTMAVIVGFASLALASPASATKKDDSGEHKVWVCHATSGLGELKNGYNLIHVDVASAQYEGHLQHATDKPKNNPKFGVLYDYIDVDPQNLPGKCGAEPSEDDEVTPAYNFTEPTCDAPGALDAGDGLGYFWLASGDGTYTAFPKDGYVLSEDDPSPIGPFNLDQLTGEQCDGGTTTTTPPTTVPEVTDPTTPPVVPEDPTVPVAPEQPPVLEQPPSLPVTGSENWIMAALAAALIAAGGGVTWLSRRPRSI